MIVSLMHNVIIRHNLDPSKFIWLWAKYVSGINEQQHCTNVLKGKYSKRLSKHNPHLPDEREILMDEFPEEALKAI